MATDIVDMLAADVQRAHQQREENRRRFPGAAALLDTYREAFGHDTKLVRAAEGDGEERRFIGKWTDEEKAALPVQFDTPQPQARAPHCGAGSAVLSHSRVRGK